MPLRTKSTSPTHNKGLGGPEPHGDGAGRFGEPEGLTGSCLLSAVPDYVPSPTGAQGGGWGQNQAPQAGCNPSLMSLMLTGWPLHTFSIWTTKCSLTWSTLGWRRVGRSPWGAHHPLWLPCPLPTPQ